MATGYAIVGYVPEIDLSGLNNALNYVKTVVGAGFGLLGPFAGPIGTVGLATIEGAGVSFGEAMAIRQGSLSGNLSGGSLRLNWHFAQRGIPYSILLALPTGNKSIGGGSEPAQSLRRNRGDGTTGHDRVRAGEQYDDRRDRPVGVDVLDRPSTGMRSHWAADTCNAPSRRDSSDYRSARSSTPSTALAICW